MAAFLAASVCVLGAAQLAQANFADAAGFSGRGGFTCVACHTQPSPQAAQVTLTGLPEAGWEPGATYALRVEVTGGPPALPAPAPQGGFDLATNGGSLAGDDSLLRFPSRTEVTYRPAGTLMRAWDLQWTAPDLATAPVAVKFWVAAIAANGNHVAALNASDGGEYLDASAAITAMVPPSQAALDAWHVLPLAMPAATVEPATGGGWVVDGQHLDANATAVAWSVDGKVWTTRDTGVSWRITLDQGAATASSTAAPSVLVRSVGAGRVSPPLTLTLPAAAGSDGGASSTVGGVAADGATRPASAPIAAASIAAFPLLAALALAARRRRP